MNEIYLNRVLIYLQQELPDYQQHTKVTNGKFIITISDMANFQRTYEDLHQAIVNSINRIRNRDIDLEFTVKSENQERDFTIFK